MSHLDARPTHKYVPTEEAESVIPPELEGSRTERIAYLAGYAVGFAKAFEWFAEASNAFSAKAVAHSDQFRAELEKESL